MENTRLVDNKGAPNEIVDDENPRVPTKNQEQPTCMDNVTEGVKLCIKGTYFGMAFVLNKVKDVCGFICYPIKEQCANCCRRFDLWMNPYKNSTIHEI
jgi:hypothetical protein